MAKALGIAIVSTLAVAGSAAAQVTLDQAALQRSYPGFAKELGIGGKVMLDCTSADGRRFSCQLISETPAGFGFAQAALEGSRTLRVQGAYGRLTLPLIYVPPGGPRDIRAAPSAESLALARAFITGGGLPEGLIRSRERPPKRGLGLEQLSPEVRAAAETVLADWRGVVVEALVNMLARQAEKRVPAAAATELTELITSGAGRELLALWGEGRLDKRTAQAWADRNPAAGLRFQQSATALSAMAIPPREAEAQLRVEIDEIMRQRLCEKVRCTLGAEGPSTPR